MNNYFVISDITLISYLLVSSLVFIIGMIGLCVNKKNIIRIFLSIEIMFLSVNINFIVFRRKIIGHFFCQ